MGSLPGDVVWHCSQATATQALGQFHSSNRSSGGSSSSSSSSCSSPLTNQFALMWLTTRIAKLVSTVQLTLQRRDLHEDLPLSQLAMVPRMTPLVQIRDPHPSSLAAVCRLGILIARSEQTDLLQLVSRRFRRC